MTGPDRPPPDSYGTPALAAIAHYVDWAFYRHTVPDLGDEDPVSHYHRAGWRAGHNPNSWFDTRWYLATYPDIMAADMNPLLHYVAHGRDEGRVPQRPGRAVRGLIDAATPAADRRTGYDAPKDAARLSGSDLLAHMLPTLAKAGFVVSLSHDCYLRVTGGIQVLVADEQAAFQARAISYLHLSPAIARLTLAPPTAEPVWLQLVLDGRFLGIARLDVVVAVLTELAPSLPAQRVFTLHSLFGHTLDGLCQLAAALGPARRWFWLHDYASLCEGFNLLRNDVAFCHAPPLDSTACQICVHGPTRPAYLAALGTLFQTVPMQVLAPSRAALDLWVDATALPYVTASVHENATFVPGPDLPRQPGPVRVAFVGYPMAAKGWPLFQALMRAESHNPAYAMFHFATAETLHPMDGLTTIAARVTHHDRDAMIRALVAHQIDLVLVLSTWPETFSYVAHEAFAAGADVIALASSGNVPDAIRRTGRGVVLADDGALLVYFARGAAAAWVLRHAGLRGPGLLIATGSCASLVNPPL